MSKCTVEYTSSTQFCTLHTDPVDEYARQDEVEYVEHWPPPDPDVIGDVDVGLVAA